MSEDCCPVAKTLDPNRGGPTGQKKLLHEAAPGGDRLEVVDAAENLFQASTLGRGLGCHAPPPFWRVRRIAPPPARPAASPTFTSLYGGTAHPDSSRQHLDPLPRLRGRWRCTPPIPA